MAGVRPPRALCATAAWAGWHWRAAAGARLEGDFPAVDGDGSLFLGKFCFDFDRANGTPSGQLLLNVTFAQESLPSEGKMYFMVFDDEESHWKDAWRGWSEGDCDQKGQMSSKFDEISLAGNIHYAEVDENDVDEVDDFTIDEYTSWKLQHRREDRDGMHHNYSLQIYEGLRPRFWYFAIVACGVRLSAPTHYALHVWNPRAPPADAEFSFDRRGLIRFVACSAGGFFVAMVATLWAVRWRPQAQDSPVKDHPYSKLLVLALVASLCSSLLFVVHYWLFSSDGFGSKRIRFLGVLSSEVANCTIFLIAILASVGWAISRSGLPYRRTFLGMVALLGAMTSYCEYHADQVIDQSTKLYRYQSIPGIAALMLKICMFCWFYYNIKETYEKEVLEHKRLFYDRMRVVVSVWALNVPVTVILAFMLSPWYRFKVVTTVELLARFLGQAMIALLLCGPSSPIMGSAPPAREMLHLGGDMEEGFVDAPA